MIGTDWLNSSKDANITNFKSLFYETRVTSLCSNLSNFYLVQHIQFLAKINLKERKISVQICQKRY